ncbi:HD domain-containing protein [Clostridium aminobutyricum]|uniref:HD domain-containing protein n=1 Tax=Clostridium aminobutyricum TaxID=33953 RepID=A0A939D7J8_CLOAM|nr:HD domain-containing protein [Clostridium aminobutyricum]MBN7772551.1 HD domain-containing protein [Clostridium aminobutyricum]
MGQKHLTVEECENLLKQYHTPTHVIRHCHAVAYAAMTLAEALNRAGSHLDIRLIQGAALIHDILRVEDKHWEKGAEIARNLGYEAEANIIAVHMTYELPKTVAELTETELVCLGDRVVKEDQYVGFEERMQYILEKVRGNKEAERRITQKIADTRILLAEIEDTIGMTIDELMKEKERVV